MKQENDNASPMTAEKYLKDHEFCKNSHGDYIYSNVRNVHSVNLPDILNDFSELKTASLTQQLEEAKRENNDLIKVIQRFTDQTLKIDYKLFQCKKTLEYIAQGQDSRYLYIKEANDTLTKLNSK